jgi:hypothetical protein
MSKSVTAPEWFYVAVQRSGGHPAFDKPLPDAFVRVGNTRVSLIRGDEMNVVKIAAIVLIVAGVLGLVYGRFSYTKKTHETTLGPIELSVKDKQTVNVPVGAGVGAIVIGSVILLFGSRKR